ncbi:hypothetical protein [Campylobacter geochelonis]|uniref:Lipoprotein n=1 Tax=Campylobacter geochelonis TaxID=1780362 RepID=A0A128EQG5_9BACT|nr:hypothetical protein [Campylobacter geochelonis]QKF71819.1 hypothetical protein CGEO_1541 [Campylobacter geochelonis]CZE47464.1 Uncharacterised protein [Campylobacter geochelonis]CZE51427.1 Uncharacterised protein [Campylobacter geochelonis]
MDKKGLLSIKNFVFIMIFIIFAGCAKHYEIPPNLEFSQKKFIVNDGKKTSQVFVSKNAQIYRFVWLEMTKSPISRKILEDGKFRNDGFLPPNNTSQELFIKLLNMIKNYEKSAVISLKNGEIYNIKMVSDE